VLYPSGFGISWSSRSGLGLGFSWSSGGFSMGFSTYSPAYYSPAYAYRPYYDSWGYRGWGYSSAYYGGWSSGWYGGFSYVYNPWPVYRTYYLYSPPTQVIYETAPRETIIYRETAPQQTIIYQEAPAPQQTIVYLPQTSPAAAQEAPFAPPEGYRCFCECQCNGQAPCTCEYPCGAEYADEHDTYRLSDEFVSYTVSLNPETIWASYAGFDRIN